jgi:tetratricopeptide (TPR) repeat protein
MAKWTKYSRFKEEFSSNIDEAQDIVWDAWDTEDPVERVALAEKALKIDPDCADAFNVLGYEEKDAEKRLEYFTRTIESFKKRHDQKFFDDTAGYFWGELETRPFMRGLQGRGKTLWDCGKHKEAIETFQYMLSLNPNDNQGIRYNLVTWLIIVGDFKNARRLFKKYQEVTACMLFSSLLLSILEKKDDEVLQNIYVSAVTANKYIVPYLLKKKKIPTTVPDHYTYGSKEEALIYIIDLSGADAWQSHPDALRVLADLAELAKGKKQPE